MRLEFRRSGGIAGIDLTANVEADQLPPEQAQVAGALLSDPAPDPGGGAGPPDGFHYELRLDDGSRSQTHRWSEGQVPADVQPLLAELGSRAQPAAPS